MSIFTLTTDFGTQDGYVGAIKGYLLSQHPQATIIDISHDIEPHNIHQGAECIARAYHQYPSASIHIVVVDPGVGSTRLALAVNTGKHWFVSPDNGVLSEILKSHPNSQIYELHSETPWWRKNTSFDGLFLFAPAAAQIARGQSMDLLGTPIRDPVIYDTPEIEIDQTTGELTCQVTSFDRFGNAITNLSLAIYNTCKLEETKIYLRSEILPLRRFYGEQCTSTPFAIFNSDNKLEVSLNQKSVRRILHLNLGDSLLLKPIKPLDDAKQISS
ncbi:MAG TPA: hypothetical protein DCZ03_04180 [Gammaproteobacteria bacterium]|nr:hypothetical protein [Gammaproteobacteria bacterium]